MIGLELIHTLFSKLYMEGMGCCIAQIGKLAEFKWNRAKKVFCTVWLNGSNMIQKAAKVSSASSVAEVRSREIQIDLMSVFIDAVQYQLGHDFGSSLDLNPRKFRGDTKAFRRGNS